MTFNHYFMGSSPISLNILSYNVKIININYIIIIINDYKLMVDCLFTI